MPIRKRDFAAIEPDNDIKIDRADDARGVFDPSQDPYPGSFYDGMGVPQELAGPVSRFFAYTMPEEVPYPKHMRVQDLLAQVRTPDNVADHVEKAYRNRVRSPLTAIRAHCVANQGGSPRAVAACDVVDCVFWPFRMGRNGMRR
jgi:hypothetical protein